MNTREIINDSIVLLEKSKKYMDHEFPHILSGLNVILLGKIYNNNYSLTDSELVNLLVDLKKIKSKKYLEILVLSRFRDIIVDSKEIMDDIYKLKVESNKFKTIVMYDLSSMLKYELKQNSVTNIDTLFDLSLKHDCHKCFEVLFPKVANNVDKNELFVRACENNKLKIARFLYYKLRVDISYNNHESFVISCLSSDLEMIKWLVSLNSNIYVQNGQGIVNACMNNNEDVILFLYNIHETSKYYEGDHVFSHICMKHGIKIVRWIYKISKINHNSFDDEPFRFACSVNNIEVAKFIYSLGNVNVNVMNGTVFKHAREKNYVELEKWLETLV